jgi:carbonic anhydrase
MNPEHSSLTDKLLTENKVWADDVRRRDPGYFKQLAKEQNPKFR